MGSRQIARLELFVTRAIRGSNVSRLFPPAIFFRVHVAAGALLAR